MFLVVLALAAQLAVMSAADCSQAARADKTPMSDELMDSQFDEALKGNFDDWQLLMEAKVASVVKQRLIRDFEGRIHCEVRRGLRMVLSRLKQQKPETVFVDAEGGRRMGSDHHSDELLDASVEGDVKRVEHLLKSGASIEAKDKDGYTPLANAAFHGHKTTVELLLDNRANIEAKDNAGHTPLALAAWHGHNNTAALLLDNGANIEAKDNAGNTPLALAAWLGHNNTAALLLDNGANTEAKDKYGWTPLALAARRGHNNTAALLLDNGANTEAKDKYGNTPLAQAAWFGHDNTAALLLDNGANVETKNEFGWTPLASAAFDGHIKTVDLLIDHGAATNPTLIAIQTDHVRTAMFLEARLHAPMQITNVIYFAFGGSCWVLILIELSFKLGLPLLDLGRLGGLFLINTLFLYNTALISVFTWTSGVMLQHLTVANNYNSVCGMLFILIFFVLRSIFDWCFILDKQRRNSTPSEGDYLSLASMQDQASPSAVEHHLNDIYQDISSSLLLCTVVTSVQILLALYFLGSMLTVIDLDSVHTFFWASSIGVQYVLLLQWNIADPSDDGHHSDHNTFWAKLLAETGEIQVTIGSNSSSLPHPGYLSIFLRWLMSRISNWLLPCILIVYTPLFLALANNGLDFAFHAFALSFIVNLDNDVISSRTQKIGRSVRLPTSPDFLKAAQSDIERA